ncbi:MAG TPA: alpha/beta hydrolase [Anaeromyxobacteraceae bacterium]|nr:alpha/beta hydrolase [Anaeromyxobacteraceae bacterium]
MIDVTVPLPVGRPREPTGASATLVSTARGPIELADVGEGPAVLALHGAMGGHDQSSLLARTIGEPRYRYVAVSRPGYLGTPIRSGRSPEEQADLYAAALDALGVRRAAVLAVSGGGPSAIHFAARHPDRCWALVLVSTCGAQITERIPLSFHLTSRLMRWDWLAEAMRRRALRDPGRAAVRSVADAAVRERMLRDPEAGPLFRELLGSTLDRPGRRLAGTENDIAVTRRAAEYPLDHVIAPTLVVHGTADRVVSCEHAWTLATRIRGAELLAVEGGEHVAIFTHRDQVRARVTAFLRRHAPGPA